ncbi:MAG TPA: hypothetical protein VJ761_24860 [Ktedonobacteraceae bacterium]|nr:hypothetical protein [Ktedonobacteraceae bacterium]
MFSIFPRFTAALFVLLLIGSIALVCVGGIALLGPTFDHGDNVEHASGKIVSIGPGMDFTLQLASGKRVFFQCSQTCHASLGHLQRHMREHAATDVYYVQQDCAGKPCGLLLAVDVD